MKRRSKTREEWLWSLRFNMMDAREALKNAFDMGNYAGVRKYAAQLERLERKLADAEQRRGGARRRHRETSVGWNEMWASRAHRAGLRDQPRTHRGNADLIRWYLRHAREADRQLFGEKDSERRRKARKTTARNVQILRRVDRGKALGFVRSLGYLG